MMDGERFDRLAKTLVMPRSRRRVFRSLTGAVVALIPGMVSALKPTPCESGVTCRGECCPKGTLCSKGKNGRCVCPTTGQPSCAGDCCTGETTCYAGTVRGDVCCTSGRICMSDASGGTPDQHSVTFCCEEGTVCTDCGNLLGFEQRTCCPEGHACCCAAGGCSGCCPSESLCGYGCCGFEGSTTPKCCGSDCGKCDVDQDAPDCRCVAADEECP
jgi:hypothetical protein